MDELHREPDLERQYTLDALKIKPE